MGVWIYYLATLATLEDQQEVCKHVLLYGITDPGLHTWHSLRDLFAAAQRPDILRQDNGYLLRDP